MIHYIYGRRKKKIQDHTYTSGRYKTLLDLKLTEIFYKQSKAYLLT